MGCLCHAWKSSAMAIKEIPKGVFLCLKRKNRRLFVSKTKNLDQICLDEKLKLFTMTKCFHFYYYRFFQQTITEHISALLMAGQIQFTLQVLSLDPPFAVLSICVRVIFKW